MKKFIVFSVTALALVAGSIMPAMAQSAPPAAAAAGQNQAYSVDTPIPQLLANPAAHEILQREVPDLIANPQVQSAPISLRQLATYAQGALTEEKLTAINTALAAVPASH